MLWRYYRLIGTGVSLASRRQLLFFDVETAINTGPITQQERVALHGSQWTTNRFAGLWRRAMERVPLWNAARMWEVHEHYDPNVRQWRINFVDFRALMITAAAEQWL